VRVAGCFWKSRKAVSPVIGVILMVAATIVIAAIVMGYLGGFKPPSKPLDIQLSEGTLQITNVTAHNWTMTFVIVGSDANALNNPSDVNVVIKDMNASNSWTWNIPTNDISIKNGSLLEINVHGKPIYPGDRVRVIVKYNPTGQILIDTVLVARKA